MNERNTYYVASGICCRMKITAKNLRGAKIKAGKIYQKSVGGRISIYDIITHPNEEKEYIEVSYWSGHDWEWHDAP